MNYSLLHVLVCPLCKGTLIHDPRSNELVCQTDRLAFPIVDGMPILLQREARITSASVPREFTL